MLRSLVLARLGAPQLGRRGVINLVLPRLEKRLALPFEIQTRPVAPTFAPHTHQCWPTARRATQRCVAWSERRRNGGRERSAAAPEMEDAPPPLLHPARPLPLPLPSPRALLITRFLGALRPAAGCHRALRCRRSPPARPPTRRRITARNEWNWIALNGMSTPALVRAPCGKRGIRKRSDAAEQIRKLSNARRGGGEWQP
ncbi:Protein of unknown function [Gryllus bimaculatus]|nr:Protein of unknown function [Gryllus bimaculatus]